MTYDNVGNTKTAPGGISYTYDARDLITGTSTPTESAVFAYDGERRQTKVTSGGVERRLRYGAPGDSGASYQTDSANVVTSANVAGPAGLMATYAGATPTYYLTSPRGDVAATVDAAGVITVAPLFDEYGNPTGAPGAYGFLGAHRKERDPATGVTLMGARAYDPSIGRFLQRDPVDGGSANDYDYVEGDPINNYDLDGERARRRGSKKFGSRARTARGGGACRAVQVLSNIPSGSANKAVAGLAATAAVKGVWQRVIRTLAGVAAAARFMTGLNVAQGAATVYDVAKCRGSRPMLGGVMDPYAEARLVAAAIMMGY